MNALTDLLAEMDAGNGWPNEDTFRAAHIGASEVAALFEASPWLTRFELWHRKNGTVATPEFGGNNRVEAGIRLERAVLDWACDEYGYRLTRYPGFRLSNGRGLGGHPDGEVECDDREGPGIVEVKTVDWLVAKKWGDEPPLHYLLQLTAYMGLAGAKWGDVVVLVGGNELRRYRYDFRPKIYAEIEAKVADFWSSIRANDPPAPDFSRDSDTLSAVIGEAVEDEVADLRADNRAAELAAQWCWAKQKAREADAELEAIKAELLLKIGTAGVALIDGFRISCGQTKGSPDREITAADVGQVIKGRRGYRRFDVREKGE